jgi:hypothetical protein
VHGNVLLLSQRRISDLVAFCLAYEFEDTFQAVTGAERIDATDLTSLEFSRRAYKLARAATGSSRAALRLAPSPRGKVALERDYDLFFPVFSNAFELYSLATIPNWRQRCRKAACFITEVWTDQLPEYLLELLSEFDHIFLGLRHCVDDVARITGRPCSYLPLATDVLRFAPAALDQPRPIDVCNIGRRSRGATRFLARASVLSALLVHAGCSSLPTSARRMPWHAWIRSILLPCPTPWSKSRRTLRISWSAIRSE